jgi:uroporphyrinogen-III synthase
VMAEAASRGCGWPAGCGVALVGPGSQEEVSRWSGRVPGLAQARWLRPEHEPYDAAALLAHPVLASLQGLRIAVLQRPDARDRWSEALRARGATVDTVAVYRARAVPPPPGAARWLERRAAARAPTAFSVASADAGRRLGRWAAALDCGAWAMSRPVLTVHRRIADALTEAGWRSVRVHRPGLEGLLVELESLRCVPND